MWKSFQSDIGKDFSKIIWVKLIDCPYDFEKSLTDIPLRWFSTGLYNYFYKKWAVWIVLARPGVGPTNKSCILAVLNLAVLSSLVQRRFASQLGVNKNWKNEPAKKTGKNTNCLVCDF